VDVTADDIERPLDRGRSRVLDCPIARAISRVWPHLSGVAGGYACLYDSDDHGNHSTCVDLPLVARAFIVDFDNYRGVKPFSFTIELPE
jgi:hypothetical protein